MVKTKEQRYRIIKYGSGAFVIEKIVKILYILPLWVQVDRKDLSQPQRFKTGNSFPCYEHAREALRLLIEKDRRTGQDLTVKPKVVLDVKDRGGRVTTKGIGKVWNDSPFLIPSEPPNETPWEEKEKLRPHLGAPLPPPKPPNLKPVRGAA